MHSLRELELEKEALLSELDGTQCRTLKRIWDGLLARWHQDQQAVLNSLDCAEVVIREMRYDAYLALNSIKTRRDSTDADLLKLYEEVLDKISDPSRYLEVYERCVLPNLNNPSRVT